MNVETGGGRNRSTVDHLLGQLFEAEAEEARHWAERLGVDRSQLLRDALHRYLARLRTEEDVEAWLRKPMTPDEGSLAEVADWGPAEDWSEWADEQG